MKRKTFLKRVGAGATGLFVAPFAANASRNEVLAQVGFEHLPSNEIKDMKSVLHKASSRGQADHGWLQARHTFSFANYYNPERMNFGVLRVLNDDNIAGGRGFGMHPHNNMEIITIPLSGMVEHKDNMGNTGHIKSGEVQVMSAGTGVMHSEFNGNSDNSLKLLQIWVLPEKRSVKPRYDQKVFGLGQKNAMEQIISPVGTDEPGLQIHQQARFYIGNFDKNHKTEYQIKGSNHGVYIFVISGSVMIDSQLLYERDGYGVWDTDRLTIKADSDARVLFMDLPMNI